MPLPPVSAIQVVRSLLKVSKTALWVVIGGPPPIANVVTVETTRLLATHTWILLVLLTLL